MTMTPFERWSVWLTTAGTLVTGVAYWWMKDVMTGTDPWSVINHPLQPWMLKAHILIAPLMVFSVGLITSRHVWRHYRMGVGKGRKTGLVSALTFGVVVLSGYLLQVLTAETLLRALGWLHLGLGVVYSVSVAAHWPATRGRPAKQVEDTEDVSRPALVPRRVAGPPHECRRRARRTRPGRTRPASAPRDDRQAEARRSRGD